ncbi:MAG TPA: hypothetical protein VFN30_01895 [Chitinophagaceae bacterium]|nr:hypothetical protein [Chitinophagaceae bacterium]
MKLYITTIAIFMVTAIHAQDKKLKEISTEVNVTKEATIRIVNVGRNINIKTWAQPKVKLTTNLLDEEQDKNKTEEEWWSYLNISVKAFSNRVEINSRGSATFSGCSTCPNSWSQGYSNTSNFYSSSNSSNDNNKTKGVRKRVLEIIVPEGSKLDIDSKGSDIVLNNNADELILDISNTTVDARDVKKLRLRSRFSTVNFLNINTAEVEFENGTFKASDITDLDIDSKTSTVEFENGKYVYIRSQNDNYSIESIDKIEGRKLYGEMRIETLNNKIDIEGNNADIKIHNLSNEVELVKLNNKYADIRLPVKNLKNYEVNFYGLYSTVFTPFEKIPVKKDEDEKEAKGEKNVTATSQTASGLSNCNGKPSPLKFTGSVGDVKGKHTRFELVCHSCTVDFK